MTSTTALLQYEPTIRGGVFVGVFALMALWEVVAPRRCAVISRSRRWPNNLAIAALNSLLLRFMFPLAAIGAAIHAEQGGWGLLPILNLSTPLAVVASIIMLDFAIYFQHRLLHMVPILWRLHRMHHADLEFDVTTGVRFHPLEMLLSMAIKIGIVVALGAPPLAVLLFELILNATSMFNHSNIALPPGVERTLRMIVVTPDMHRVHHSTVVRETNSNFGFNVPWWDRAFGTYRAQPAAGHGGMTIGIPLFREPGELRLDRMLLQPFRKGKNPGRGCNN